MQIKPEEYTSAALHKDTADWLAEVIKARQPEMILEFGTGQGVGTRTILNNCQGKVVSVEHQSKWIEYAKEWNDYGDRLQIVSYSDVPDLKYDFVIIDGKDREKCFIDHYDKIASGAFVILDDGNRQTEIEIVNNWEKRFNIEFRPVNVGRGVWTALKW